MAAVCILDEFEVHKNEKFLKRKNKMQDWNEKPADF